jgi:hypothetical protein
MTQFAARGLIHNTSLQKKIHFQCSFFHPLKQNFFLAKNNEWLLPFVELYISSLLTSKNKISRRNIYMSMGNICINKPCFGSSANISICVYRSFL